MSIDIKTGLALVIDRVEALRVRIDALAAERLQPPVTVGDEHLVALLGHWRELCVEALTEASRLRLMTDRITALLALSADAPPDAISEAVRTCVRHCEKLELRIAEFSSSSS